MNGMKRWFDAFVFLSWSVVTASAADTFVDRIATLQTQLQSDPTNTLILFQLGDLCHDKGANNDEKAVVLAEDCFKRLLAIDPDNAMARVMYGSVLTMKARDALWPLTQLTLAKRGIREMDAAVDKAPNDAQVRFARAINNFHMPDMMERREIVQADLVWLWQQAQLPDSKLKVCQKQTIALRYGQILQKKNQPNEAIQVWRAGLALAPKSLDAAPLTEQLLKRNARLK
jgi:tetratricopeptide (TPR) repeat protein